MTIPVICADAKFVGLGVQDLVAAEVAIEKIQGRLP